MYRSAELEQTPALDPVGLVTAITRATGDRLELIGRAAGGEVGAAFVRRADGSECVLSRGGDAGSLRLAARALDIARTSGVPVPRYLNVVDTSAGVALLQERLPGQTPDQVADKLVAQLIDVVDRLGGLLAGADWMTVPDLYLDHSGPGYCVHESLQRHDRRSRRLLGWVREVGRTHGSHVDGDDLVHLDLHPANVLVDDAGVVSGVIDWDAAGRGDARLGLVTLLFDLDRGIASDPCYSALSGVAYSAVAERIMQIPADQRRMFWAHMALREVDWSLRHHSAEGVDLAPGLCLDGS